MLKVTLKLTNLVQVLRKPCQ